MPLFTLCFVLFVCYHDNLCNLDNLPTTIPHSNAKSSFDDLLCSPESTAKTADSGIESLAQRLSEDHTQLGSSLDSSPTPPTTGNEEVDQCLIYHLTYCERLLEVREHNTSYTQLKLNEILYKLLTVPIQVATLLVTHIS